MKWVKSSKVIDSTFKFKVKVTGLITKKRTGTIGLNLLLIAWILTKIMMMIL